jgi:hypothetical protein
MHASHACQLAAAGGVAGAAGGVAVRAHEVLRPREQKFTYMAGVEFLEIMCAAESCSCTAASVKRELQLPAATQLPTSRVETRLVYTASQRRLSTEPIIRG